LVGEATGWEVAVPHPGVISKVHSAIRRKLNLFFFIISRLLLFANNVTFKVNFMSSYLDLMSTLSATIKKYVGKE